MGFQSFYVTSIIVMIHSHEKPHSKSPRKKACELTKRKEKKRRPSYTHKLPDIK